MLVVYCGVSQELNRMLSVVAYLKLEKKRRGVGLVIDLYQAFR